METLMDLQILNRNYVRDLAYLLYYNRFYLYVDYVLKKFSFCLAHYVFERSEKKRRE
jgi:hypothetical protein